MKYDEEAFEFTKRKLDEINISKIVSNLNITSMNHLISYLEDKYDDTDFTNNEYMEGHLFNWMSRKEFVDYLTGRYSTMHIKEIYDYNIDYEAI